MGRGRDADLGVARWREDDVRNPHQAADAEAPMPIAAVLTPVALRGETVAAETLQTRLDKRVIAIGQRENSAYASRLVYEIEAESGDVRLVFFRPREAPSGVSAAPWNAR